MLTRSLLTAACLAGASTATAQSVTAAYPETIVAALQDLGYRAVLETDSTGDPQVNSAINGLNYAILFYGCTDGRDCRDLQFRASFETEGSVSTDMLHDWNRDFFLGKAYLDGRGSTVIEHAVIGVDGVSRDNFERILWRWENALTGFTEAIDW